MKRTHWSVGLRNKLAELALECDSASAVGSASHWEREDLQNKLRNLVACIDNKIKVVK